MNLVLNIILVVGPLIIGIYLSIRGIPRRTKTVVWILCALISLCGVILLAKQEAERRRESKATEYYRQSQERRELYSKGFPTRYLDGLGENPLLKHSFEEGERYEKEHKFDEAIGAYKKCVLHPNATEENKIAANILIGSCYYSLSNLRKAEDHYKAALSISKKVKDKDERLQGKSAALGNIGLIYSDWGQPAEALRYLNEALEICRSVGYESGIAGNLGNIGIVHCKFGKPEEALRYLSEALQIDKRIGYKLGIANQLGNIGNAHYHLGKPDEALKYQKEALEIHRRIGYEQGIASNLNNIGLIYSGLGKPDEALKCLKEALEIFRRIGAQRQIKVVSRNISDLEEEKKKRTR